MKPRKDQTDDQRIMRDMGAMMLRYLPKGADMKLELKKLWLICPHGYKNFEAFFWSVLRLTRKTGNSYPKISLDAKNF